MGGRGEGEGERRLVVTQHMHIKVSCTYILLGTVKLSTATCGQVIRTQLALQKGGCIIEVDCNV